MLGTIIGIEENQVLLKLAIDVENFNNLINIHVVMEEGNRKIVGEIINIKEGIAYINLLGEIININFVFGVIVKPAFSSTVKLISKEKIPMIIAVVVAIAICIAALYFFESYESVYYTQIDNTKVAKLSSTDDMKYEYTLDCYNEKGKKKELKFKTSRELREDAFLKLEVKTFGVHSWEEVQYDELPEKVQTNYTK